MEDSEPSNSFFAVSAERVPTCHDLTCAPCVSVCMLVHGRTGWCMELIPCIGFAIDQGGCGKNKAVVVYSHRQHHWVKHSADCITIMIIINSSSSSRRRSRNIFIYFWTEMNK